MMEKSLTSLRLSRAISTKEKRIKRAAILHHLLEMEGYDPRTFKENLALAVILRKMAYSRISPDLAARRIKLLILSGEIT
jgi:hypothetical protein